MFFVIGKVKETSWDISQGNCENIRKHFMNLFLI